MSRVCLGKGGRSSVWEKVDGSLFHGKGGSRRFAPFCHAAGASNAQSRVAAPTAPRRDAYATSSVNQRADAYRLKGDPQRTQGNNHQLATQLVPDQFLWQRRLDQDCPHCDLEIQLCYALGSQAPGTSNPNAPNPNDFRQMLHVPHVCSHSSGWLLPEAHLCLHRLQRSTVLSDLRGHDKQRHERG